MPFIIFGNENPKYIQTQETDKHIIYYNFAYEKINNPINILSHRLFKCFAHLNKHEPAKRPALSAIRYVVAKSK